MIVTNLGQTFLSLFHGFPEKAFFAPGRMNLIGEHTDYNGGHALPCAITRGTYALARKRNDQIIRLYSVNLPDKGIIEFDLHHLTYEKEHQWANYPKGMIRSIRDAGFELPTGFEAVIEGDIPHGAGLSSSASIEMLTGVMISGLYGLEIPCLELIRMGKQTENQFLGVQSGIMDQFAAVLGKKDSAILLDSQALTYRYVPISLGGYQIIIMNTNKRRELVNSNYNERRSECDEALQVLQNSLPITALGQLSEKLFAENQHLITNETVRRRARHAVTENSRTLKASEELTAGNIKAFGKLMNQSHISLRDDYGVTGPELDCLVEASWAQQGVLGARMTGAGFGGCAIAIVARNETERFIADIGAIYQQKFGRSADFYFAEIGDGAREIEVKQDDQ